MEPKKKKRTESESINQFAWKIHSFITQKAKNVISVLSPERQLIAAVGMQCERLASNTLEGAFSNPAQVHNGFTQLYVPNVRRF